jgi:TPP-dependent trihydroxycyclohexane-1,2-dione (THcHDO) dehydratase
LSRNPIGGRICCDIDPDKISATEPDDDESIEQVETDGRNNEQVHGGNVRRVVMQEGPPCLAGRPSPFDHVLGDARLRDLKPELFINGIVEANRNRAPVILIASQIVRDELGFDFPQEVDSKAIYGSCSVYCDMILTPEQARRKTVMACHAAIAKRGVAVLIVPVDISHSDVHDDVPFAVHTSHPVVRPTDADLDEIASIINAGQQIAIYGGSGCRGAHDEILRVAEILKAPIAHTSRGKDSLEYDNPYNVGMTGLIATRRPITPF